MSSLTHEHFERLDELLCDHVTCGLSDSGVIELESLSGADEALEAMELAAAATAIAVLPGWGAIPEQVRQRVEHAAPSPLVVGRAERTPRIAGRLNWVPWTLVAASMTLAVLGWWPRVVGTGVDPERLATEEGTVTTQWAHWSAKPPTEDPAAKDVDWAKGVQGRVIWNAEKQEGFMYFSGMKPNDPREFQYQLWIIDAEQKHPVDGGVFDVPSDVGSRDVVVRITPKIRVSSAAAFAITIERPGGVVVSEQHERVVVAAVGK